MDFDTIVTFLVAITSLLMGLLVLISNRKNVVNKLFFAFNLFTSLWIFSSLAAKYSDINTVQPFVGIGFAAASFVIYFFLMFSLVFPNAPAAFSRWWHVLLALPLIFSALSFLNLVAKAVPAEGTNFTVAPGTFYFPYSIFLLVYAVASIVKLITNYRREKGIIKEQIRYVLAGFTVFIFLALFFSLVLPIITHFENAYRGGIYSVIILIIFIAYAIIEQGFLNIKVILTETAVSVVVLALLVQTLLSENLTRGFINGVILMVVAYGGYLIVMSVKKEIQQNKKLKNLTHHLEDDKEDLVALDKLKDEFLQMATHELNTPITVIKGKLDMAVREDYCHLDQEQKAFFSTVLDDTDRLGRLSKDILNTARIDQKRLQLNCCETDIDHLITAIVDGLQIKAKERGNKIEYLNISGQTLPKLNIDQSKISEVITNLLNNAIKFTDNGVISVKTNIEDSKVIISVADSGIGIDKEDQKHLFEKFYQAKRFDTENPQEQQGSGLGLYISKNIIKLHGGDISVESEPGKGSTFIFYLPKEYKETKIGNGKLHCGEDQVRVL